MIGTKKFDMLYERLNPEQKDAVDAIEGPVMVVAGPGTGKTQILTLRIANILRQTDTSPSSILALTFTESGAYSMRKRLVEIVGSAGYRVKIATFHGFCNDVIKNYPDSFPRIIGSTNLNDVEKIILLKQIIDETALKLLKPFGDHYAYLHAIRSSISDLKRENRSPEELLAKIKLAESDIANASDRVHAKGAHKGKVKSEYVKREKELARNKELTVIYKAYEDKLREGRQYDYEDMILEVIAVLKDDKDLLLELQEEYQYLLADEHQDANGAQNTLLELLSGFYEQPNLFVVGDEKQAIFRFQGASLENFTYFQKRFPVAKMITLRDNYRSTQSILDASHTMIGADGVVREPLKSAAQDVGTKISIHAFTKAEYEYGFLASDIRDRIAAGTPASEIAVLYRDNKDVLPILSVLEKTDIPFIIESDQNILLDPEIQKLLLLLRAVRNFGNDEYLAPVLHIDFLRLPHLDTYKLIRRGRGGKIHDLMSRTARMEEAEVEEADKYHKFYTLLSSWHSFSQNRTLLETLELVTRESGFVSHLLESDEGIATMEKLSALFDEAQGIVEQHRTYKLTDFLTYIDLMEEHNITIKKDARKVVDGRVRLMTTHRSKGLEFDHVYVIGATDGHWGNRKIRDKIKLPFVTAKDGSDESDERRLFYVALTRARESVSITYAQEGADGRLQLPSQFIEEIDSAHKQVVDVSVIERELASKPEERFAQRKPQGPSADDKEYLAAVFEEQGLSVTALNNYLTCPWQYFYRNLVRLPHSQTKHQMYGVAVHEALKHFFDLFNHGDEVSKDLLLSLFTRELESQPLAESELTETKEKGTNALSGYFDTYSSTWNVMGSDPITFINEFDVRGVLFETQTDPFDETQGKPVRLRGKIDKVEIIDATGSVNVIDYKTAKPKSRNDILGETKASNGDYFRQLVFYKILLDRFDNSKYTVRTGEIDFIEPNERGKYKKEQFEISSDDTVELSGEIERVVSEIRSFSFWNEKCDNPSTSLKGNKDCEYCKLRATMS